VPKVTSSVNEGVPHGSSVKPSGLQKKSSISTASDPPSRERVRREHQEMHDPSLHDGGGKSTGE